MGILSDFEDRIAAGIEGLFAGAFRSPVQPVELARALTRAADDGRVSTSPSFLRKTWTLP